MKSKNFKISNIDKIKRVVEAVTIPPVIINLSNWSGKGILENNLYLPNSFQFLKTFKKQPIHLCCQNDAVQVIVEDP